MHILELDLVSSPQIQLCVGRGEAGTRGEFEAAERKLLLLASWATLLAGSF